MKFEFRPSENMQEITGSIDLKPATKTLGRLRDGHRTRSSEPMSLHWIRLFCFCNLMIHQEELHMQFLHNAACRRVCCATTV